MPIIVHPDWNDDKLHRLVLARCRACAIFFLAASLALMIANVTVDQEAGLAKGVTWVLMAATLSAFSLFVQNLFFCAQVYKDIDKKVAFGAGEITHGFSFFSGGSWIFLAMFLSAVLYFAVANSGSVSETFLPLRLALILHSGVGLLAQYFVIKPLGDKVEYAFYHNILLPNLDDMLKFALGSICGLFRPFYLASTERACAENTAACALLVDGATPASVALAANHYYTNMLYLVETILAVCTAATVVYGVNGLEGSEFYWLGATVAAILAYAVVVFFLSTTADLTLPVSAQRFIDQNNMASWVAVGTLGPVTLACVLYAAYFSNSFAERADALVPMFSALELFVFLMILTGRFAASVAPLYKADLSRRFFLYGFHYVAELFAYGAGPLLSCFALPDNKTPEEMNAKPPALPSSDKIAEIVQRTMQEQAEGLKRTLSQASMRRGSNASQADLEAPAPAPVDIQAAVQEAVRAALEPRMGHVARDEAKQ